LSLDPKDLVALKVLARIHLDCFLMDEAREVCQRILTLNPGDPDAQTMLEQCAVPLSSGFHSDSSAPIKELQPHENLV
jgi:hypothetical protein